MSFMKLPQKCCCCCSLQTGALVLGWGGLISSILDTSSVAAALGNQGKQENGYGVVTDYTLLYLLIAFILNLVIYILLLLGAYQKKRLYLIPWLVIQAMAMQSLIVMVVYYGALLIRAENYSIAASIILIGFAIIGMNFYWWLCVLSLYNNLSQTTVSDDGIIITHCPTHHVDTSTADKPPTYTEVMQTV